MIIKNITEGSLCIVTGGLGLLKNSKFYVSTIQSVNTNEVSAKIIMVRNGKAGRVSLSAKTVRINIVYNEDIDFSRCLKIDIIQNKKNILQLSSPEFAAYVKALFCAMNTKIPRMFIGIEQDINMCQSMAYDGDKISTITRMEVIKKLLNYKKSFSPRRFNIKIHINSILNSKKAYGCLLDYEHTHNRII